MHKFLSFIKEFRIPQKKYLVDAFASFSKKEFYIFLLFIVIAFVSLLIILNKINNKFLVSVPVSGGSIKEGIIGMPTLVNPVLSVSDADKDLVALVYSGLMRRKSDGTFITDLAESYEISPDGLNYTFVIKNNAKFQNGEKVTSDDIVFTINKIKNPAIKSPRRIGWDGILVEKIDDKKVVFKLDKPYISFLDNTTMGILPSQVWKDVKDSEFNISPLNIKAIGSGPYKIKSVKKNNDGIPKEYLLKNFSGFTLGNPHVKEITIISFSNEKDLMQGLLSKSIEQAGSINPKNASDLEKAGNTIHTGSTSRIFGLFYNSANNKIFSDSNIINAFNYALDKQEIVDQVMYGYGTIVNSPIPETIFKNETKINSEIDLIGKANELLDKNGWNLGEDGVRVKGGITTTTRTRTVKGKTITEKVKVNNGPLITLQFSLTTGDTPELRAATLIIKKQLEKIGARVNLEKVYEMGPLNQIIQSREYEALFFGQQINHESDLFSFWHSSQKKNPGLNISMYSNPRVDRILEEAQKTINPEDRNSKYKIFVEEFNKNLPAFLIYTPKYLYATSNKLNNITLNTLITPSNRFSSVYEWYANKDRVWKIFTK